MRNLNRISVISILSYILYCKTFELFHVLGKILFSIYYNLPKSFLTCLEISVGAGLLILFWLTNKYLLNNSNLKKILFLSLLYIVLHLLMNFSNSLLLNIQLGKDEVFDVLKLNTFDNNLNNSYSIIVTYLFKLTYLFILIFKSDSNENSLAH